MPELTKDKVWALIELEDKEFFIEAFRKKHDIDPENSVFYMSINRFIKEKKLKRLGRGLYKRLKQVRRIRVLGESERKPVDIKFPCGHDDDSSFGFEGMVEIDEGDVIVIAGVSNSAKTAWVINMLARNLDDFPCLLMGNEYTRVDNKLSPKFVRRMRRMSWANWENGNGELKFDILPVNEDYEIWVESGKLNFIDWISLDVGVSFDIGKVIEAIKEAVGSGIAVVVLQKNEEKALGRGGAPSVDMADFYITIDPVKEMKYLKRLTVVKAKATSGYLDGRMWGFEIVNGGTQFHNIREIKKCPSCWAKGYTTKGECDNCLGLGYVDRH